MIGYKAFNIGLINRYGQKFEIGKTYSANGEISFGNKGNGFHFCENLSDVYRYFDFEEGIEVAVVSTNDKGKDIVCYEDEYNGYYGMYACRNLKIEKVLTREEIIEIIINSPIDQILNYIKTDKLSNEECSLISSIDKEADLAIKYYQLNDKDVYSKEYNNSNILKLL